MNWSGDGDEPTTSPFAHIHQKAFPTILDHDAGQAPVIPAGQVQLVGVGLRVILRSFDEVGGFLPDQSRYQVPHRSGAGLLEPLPLPLP